MNHKPSSNSILPKGWYLFSGYLKCSWGPYDIPGSSAALFNITPTAKLNRLTLIRDIELVEAFPLNNQPCFYIEDIEAILDISINLISNHS